MLIDPIQANPLPGGFNVTGSLTSSNGTGLSDTNGNPLNPTLIFSIDGESANFTVPSVVFNSDGTWSAQIRLDLSFPRGPHGIDISFTPQVTYFSSASAFTTFNSRGYTVLTIESPDDLDPDNRTTRGDTFDMSLSIIDNSGSPVSSATVVVEVDNITVWGGLTDSNGPFAINLSQARQRSWADEGHCNFLRNQRTYWPPRRRDLDQGRRPRTYSTSLKEATSPQSQGPQ